MDKYSNLYNTEEKTAIITEKSIVAKLQGSKAYLVEIYGDNLGKKIEIDEDYLLIGRDPSCDIVINSSSVSRRHVKIYKQYLEPKNKNYFTYKILDLDSTNGTYVGDTLIINQELINGDIIKIGSTIFKFIVGSNLESAYFEEIYRLTIIDGLTQIYNKRTFLEYLAKEVNRAERYKRDLSLIMLDIDFFKKVNDVYGHLAGDYVLKQLARIISNNIRQEEIFARYGGEEFSIIMPETSKKHAVKLAEKLRKLIETTTFIHEGELLSITISLGVAQLDKKMTPTNLISVADKNLYEAKDSGRNCVVG